MLRSEQNGKRGYIAAAACIATLLSSHSMSLKGTFLVHHKSGTFLMYDLAEDIAAVQNSTLMYLESVVDPGICLERHSTLCVLTLSSFSNRTKIFQMTSNTPVIHMVRNPLEMIVSAYQYHRNGHECSNWFGLEACSYVRSHDKRNALHVIGAHMLVHYISVMDEVTLALRQRRSEFIELKMEKFQCCYLQSTRKMLRSLHVDVDNVELLLEEMARHNIWANGSRVVRNHVSPVSDKIELRRIVLADQFLCHKIKLSQAIHGYQISVC